MTQLTEEELELQKKFALLRKQKKILSELKKQRKEASKSNGADGTNKSGQSVSGQKKSSKEESKGKSLSSSSSSSKSESKSVDGKKSRGRVEETEKTAEQRKEEAKLLVAKGLIKININERKKQEFKRSRNLERRLEDPDKSGNASVDYTPFSAASSEKDEEGRGGSSSSSNGGSGIGLSEAKRKVGTYDNFFVKAGDRRESTSEEDAADLDRRVRERDRQRERDADRRKSHPAASPGAADAEEPPNKKSALHRDDIEGRGGEDRKKRTHPAKGNTLFVKGHGLNEDIVRTAFSRHGNILLLKADPDNPHNWFVTFADSEDAAVAARRMDATMVADIHLHVVMARHQPDVEALKASAANAAAVAAAERDAGGVGGAGNKRAREWTSMALSNDHKGEHMDQRSLVTYDIDEEFE